MLVLITLGLVFGWIVKELIEWDKTHKVRRHNNKTLDADYKARLDKETEDLYK
jgi:hypothetical protein